jgi:putative chitinase
MSLVLLQKKIGATADGVFGKETLTKAMAYYKLSPIRTAHFFAQTAHETGGFRLFTENLNYSAEGLTRTFAKYFPTMELAKQYERKPEKIANRVYANRMGNGDEASGDGWKNRGRGALQLTGEHNYRKFAEYLGKPEILINRDLVATEYAFESAMFFFEVNKLWQLCDAGTGDQAILVVTKKINGGTHGLADREAKTRNYAKMLGL